MKPDLGSLPQGLCCPLFEIPFSSCELGMPWEFMEINRKSHHQIDSDNTDEAAKPKDSQ